tara:strand:- start:1048 stop:1575 length:528 start_codon:yes stop_codon:yes gene_type:complete
MKIKFILFLFFANIIAAMEIHISVENQELSLINNERVIKTYKISTSSYGEGSEEGSYKTPLGEHIVQKKIGDGVKIGGRFEGRVFNGEIYPIYLDDKIYADGDVVQTRILWLSGVEEGKNKGDGIDSFNRFIYIHGTPEEWLLGTKASKGCIRMSNKDVIELYDLVREQTKVFIK